MNKNIMQEAEQWKELAIKAQGGDKRAYHALLTDILPFIKTSIINGLADPDWADDILQDVLISVHKSLNSYQADRPFKPWLRAIISFRRSDFLRKHYKLKKIKECGRENSEIFSQKVIFQDDIGELSYIEGAISSLPLKQQKIFKMMKIEGYSAKEVASEMGMSIPAVKVSSHRTINKLRNILSNND